MSCKSRLPLAHTPYGSICTKGCPNFKRNENGQPCCTKMEGEGYGQLDELVRAGAGCPEGNFDAVEPLSEVKPEPEPEPEPKQEASPTIFDSLMAICNEIVFRLDDGELTWKRK